MELDTTNWSGDGDFTQKLIAAIKEIDDVAFLRVEDAPASRAEAGYNFISNELFVGFNVRERREPTRRFGVLPGSRTVSEKAMTLAELEAALTRLEDVGPPDYADQGMIQYLRSERIIPPYQTRGYKLVELVRVYEVGGPKGPPY